MSEKNTIPVFGEALDYVGLLDPTDAIRALNAQQCPGIGGASCGLPVGPMDDDLCDQCWHERMSGND